MSDVHHFPYGGANHRIIRAYIGIALSGLVGLTALVWWMLRFVSALRLTSPPSAAIIDAVVLVGFGLYLLWTAYLSLCNVFVTTAEILLSEDQVELVTGDGRISVVRHEDIDHAAAARVLYRLGAGRSLFRLRKQPAPAIFIPVRRLSGSLTMFRVVARMYAGNTTRYGFLITPDHAGYEHLLDHLSINKGGSHE